MLLADVTVGVKVFDLSGRHEARAERVQHRITERLRRVLGVVPITVVAYGSPGAPPSLVIEVTGSVRDGELRDAILGSVRSETARLGHDIRVEDRLEVQARADRHAA